MHPLVMCVRLSYFCAFTAKLMEINGYPQLAEQFALRSVRFMLLGLKQLV